MIVKRSYVSKKTGKVVTKSYKYDSKRYKSKVNKLTTKKGTLSKKADELLTNEFGDANQHIKDYVVDTINQYQAEKKVITLGQIKAMASGNRVSIFLANFQLSIDDIAKQIKLQGEDVSEQWLLDQSHWKFYQDDDADITLPSGKLAYFVFNYYEHTYDIEVR